VRKKKSVPKTIPLQAKKWYGVLLLCYARFLLLYVLFPFTKFNLCYFFIFIVCVICDKVMLLNVAPADIIKFLYHLLFLQNK